MSSEKEVFKIGDRVILTGLVKAKSLNNRHGVIALDLDPKTERYAVDLDLPSDGIAVKASNLKHEPPIPADAESRRAAVVNGILIETQGRAFSFIIDQVRYVVGRLLLKHPDIQIAEDIQRIKDESMIMINYLTATAWSHWVDIGAYESTGGKCLYKALKDWVQNQLFGDTPYAQLPPIVQLASDAIAEPSAVGGWNVRIHGSFWIVGDTPSRDEGTYCVLACNPRCVYEVLGMTQALGPMISFSHGQGASLFSLTMIPWYGRLLYDGAVCPLDSGENPSRSPYKASASKLAKLRESIRLAKEEGRVVSRLAQLEVPGGSLDGVRPHLDASPLAEDEEDSEEEDINRPGPSPEENQYISNITAINSLPVSLAGPQAGRAKWTFRRRDYTEKENPNFIVFVLQCIDAPDAMLGQFKCAALEPTPCEVLKALAEFSEMKGFRPISINVDDKNCFKRVRFLLKDIMNVLYCIPPSKEEQMAQFLCDASGLNPTAGCL